MTPQDLPDGADQKINPLQADTFADHGAAGSDLKPRTTASSPEEGADPIFDGAIDPVADLGARLAAAEAKAAEHYDALLRTRADSENMRRRTQEEVAKARKYGLESFAEYLLPVFDSLLAASTDTTGDVAKVREGVELTLRQLKSAFEKGKLMEIDPVGEKFDPHKHQAISAQPSMSVPPNHVVSVLQKGWMIADRVLRPALVTVAQAE